MKQDTGCVQRDGFLCVVDRAVGSVGETVGYSWWGAYGCCRGMSSRPWTWTVMGQGSSTSCPVPGCRVPVWDLGKEVAPLTCPGQVSGLLKVESLNHRTVWVGGDSKAHLVSPPVSTAPLELVLHFHRCLADLGLRGAWLLRIGPKTQGLECGNAAFHGTGSHWKWVFSHQQRDCPDKLCPKKASCCHSRLLAPLALGLIGVIPPYPCSSVAGAAHRGISCSSWLLAPGRRPWAPDLAGEAEVRN